MAWAALTYGLLEVACHLFLPPSPMVRGFHEVRDLVTAGPQPRVQVMGDSVAHDGILATLMDAGDRTIRNDALEGSGPVFSYLLLRQEIAAHRVPECLLLAHSPHTFGGVRNSVLIGHFAAWREIPGLAWRARNPSDVIYGILARFSYLLSYRDEMKEMLLGRSKFFREWAKPSRSEEERLSAYRDLEGMGQFRPKRLPDGVSSTNTEPFRVSPVVDYYFRRLLDTAQASGIEVYWINMPVTRRVSDFREQSDYYDELSRYMDQFVVRGQLRYLQREVLVYDDSRFDDLSHLNMSGAVDFSLHLREGWEAETRERRQSVVPAMPGQSTASFP